MASAMKIKSTKSPNGTETGSIVAVLSASSFWCQLKRREGQRQSPFFDSTGDLSYTGLIGTYPGWAELLIPPATLLCFTRVAMVSPSQGHKAHSTASQSPAMGLSRRGATSPQHQHRPLCSSPIILSNAQSSTISGPVLLCRMPRPAAYSRASVPLCAAIANPGSHAMSLLLFLTLSPSY